MLFFCNVESPSSKKVPETTVGIDLGLSALATLSTGEKVENPWFGKAEEARIRRWSKALARRQRGSRSQERARVQLAKVYTGIHNRRVDHARKLAVTLFKRFDLVAYEDLAIQNMVRGTFAKSIHDASWSILTKAIRDKAESAGLYAVKVDPRGTSQQCSGCGTIVKKVLSERRHVCECGTDLDRDHNAALNVLRLGLSRVEGLKSGPVEAEQRRI